MFYGKISLIHENLVVFWEISAIFAVKGCFQTLKFGKIIM